MIKERGIIIGIVVCLVTCAKADIDPYGTDPNSPAGIEGYELIWSDEFNNTGKPDPACWSFESGFIRNEESQWYQEDNAFCRDGALHIEARKESFVNPDYNPASSDWRLNRKNVEYTSASINTSGKKFWRYGRFEVRAKIPAYDGSWPAIWTLGTMYEWPSCGEIDIMEYYDHSILANAAWGTAKRWQAAWDSSKTPMTSFTARDENWSGKYHVWRMDWTSEYIKLYLDDELLNTIELSKTQNADGINPFKIPHYILLNLALGGQHGGNPENPPYPIVYSVDYVRIYQEKSAEVNDPADEEIRYVMDDNAIRMISPGYKGADVRMFHLSGELVAEKRFGSEADRINISGFARGMYLLQTNYMGNIDVTKFLIR